MISAIYVGWSLIDQLSSRNTTAAGILPWTDVSIFLSEPVYRRLDFDELLERVSGPGRILPSHVKGIPWPAT